ncbi:MAG TPA: oligosaccharide flippase family protein [Candidatus Hydrogenedentes bacterium]|nr:oligosaccharide flippase family protein [Candidatus Hydrogenedentota bacterium]HRK34141.1 oligosaccharide flippase family protein [Candidatus Hydrogenedentota bacterium]
MSVAFDTDTAPLVDEATPKRRSLKEMLLHGSSWTMLEYGLSQILRLGSNIALASLLGDPAIFGINLILMVFMQALDMFSDLGIGQSVIHSKRGDDPRFLDTAWTIQVIRGFAFTAAALMLAWPVSVVYQNSILLYALPLAGLAGIISGFNSINLYVLNRHIRLGRIALINVGTQAIAIAATLAFAYYSKTVWALIAGALFSSLVKLVASHLLCPGPRSRFAWDKSATKELFHFGKWIFFSTLFGFLASRGDQLLLGWYMPAEMFGTYGFAVLLAQAVAQGMHQISQRVLFPIYARVATEDPDRLRIQTFRVRAVLMALSVPPVCILAIWGQEVVDLIYPEKFKNAGWMLQILAAGGVVSVIGSTIGPVLLAKGDSYRFMILQVVRTAIMCVTMALGGYFGGRTGHPNGAMIGVVVGVALPELLLYPVLVWAVRRYGVWLPKLDFAGFALAGLAITAGLLL